MQILLNYGISLWLLTTTSYTFLVSSPPNLPPSFGLLRDQSISLAVTCELCILPLILEPICYWVTNQTHHLTSTLHLLCSFAFRLIKTFLQLQTQRSHRKTDPNKCLHKARANRHCQIQADSIRNHESVHFVQSQTEKTNSLINLDIKQ